MLEELTGKKVTIHLGAVSGISDSVKGEIVEVKDGWLKLKSKTTTELIRQEMIKRVSIKSSDK
jgi:hypothetical protein